MWFFKRRKEEAAAVDTITSAGHWRELSTTEKRGRKIKAKAKPFAVRGKFEKS